MALAVTALGVIAAPATAAPGTTPDGSRGYELVSAGDKNSDGVLGGGGFNTGAPLLSRDGDHAVFPSLTAFIGANTAPFFQTYGARRTGDGWAVKALVPAPPAGSTGTVATGGDWNVTGWTADFQTEFGIAYNASWDPDDRDGEPGADLYASDGSSLPSWISRGSGPKLTPDTTQFEGSSTDGRYVAFRTSGKLDPRDSDPATGRQSGESMYLRDREAGTTTLVGVGNDGQLLNRCGTSGAAGSFAPASNGGVSDDGQRIFFQAGFTYGNAGACTASDVNGQIFVREDGEKTVLVSPRRRTVPDPAGRQVPSWRGATPSGNAVVFSSGELLTDDAQAVNGIYRFELPTAAHPDGVLTDLTPKTFAGAQSVDQYGAVAISRDGSVVAFSSTSALTAGAPADGSTKLYVHSGGQLRLVGVVSPDAQNAPRVDDATLALSPDGSKLAFVAVQPQTGAPDHTGTSQVYLADTATATPSCVSCGTSGVPAGSANLGPTLGRLAATGRNTRNPVTDDGQVAFQTPTALLRTDTNNRTDVYVRRPDGSVALITTGRASADAELVGASDDGRSVAFVTTETLTWDDVDHGDADVYIARTGGGFAAPAAAADCDGDVCQGQPTPQAALDRAASAFVVGPGNVVPPKDAVGGSSKLTVRAVTAAERRAFGAGKRLSLRLQVTRGGTATVTATARVGKQTRTVARATQRKQGAGTIKVGLRLSTAARRELTRTGRLRVTITVRHTGAPSRTTAFTLTTTKKGR